jgi:hypothetical protein
VKTLLCATVCVLVIGIITIILLAMPLPTSQIYLTNNSYSFPPLSLPTDNKFNTPQLTERKNVCDIASQKTLQNLSNAKDNRVLLASSSVGRFGSGDARGGDPVRAKIIPNSLQTRNWTISHSAPLFQSSLPPQSMNSESAIDNSLTDIFEVANAPFFSEVKKVLNTKQMNPQIAQELDLTDVNFATMLEESGINKDDPEFFDTWQEAAQTSDDILRSRIGWQAFNALSAQTLQAERELYVNSTLKK